MLKKRRAQGQRGQAIVEAALFCPLLLLSLAGLLLFSRLGVVAERGESAVRYANLVTFRHGQIYTMATVYDLLGELLNPSSAQLGPLCLTPNAVTSSPPPQNTISAAALQAYTQSQPATSSTAVPITRNFWKPDSMTAPVCNPLSVQLTSSTYGISDLPLSVTSFQLQGTIAVPGYLNSLVGRTTSTTANMAFLNLATPNMLVTCVPGLSIVLDVLSDMKGHGATANCNTGQNPVTF